MPDRIGIFGGTFDPVHIGHLIAAAELRHALHLDRVLFVPTGSPPHKGNVTVAPAADRLAMLQLAIAGEPSFAVSTIELDRTGPSYTVDTLAALRSAHPDATLILLMGEDSLRDLPAWREPDRILALAEVGVATRPGVDVDLTALSISLPAARDRVTVVPIPSIGVSSRDIRRRVTDGLPITFLTPRTVGEHIFSNGLYRDLQGRGVTGTVDESPPRVPSSGEPGDRSSPSDGETTPSNSVELPDRRVRNRDSTPA